MSLSLVIADDHPLILKGLSNFLTEKNYTILGSAKDGKEALKLILKHQPDVAVLDIRMPGLSGLEIAKKCHDNLIETKIVLITFEKDGSLLTRAKDLNVHGYILKEFALAEIEACLHSVQNGSPYFSPNLMDFISEDKSAQLELLTPTEKKVVLAISENKTTKEIADNMFISYRTVEKHRSNIINKLGLPKHQNALLIWAKENQQHFL